jgi:hypothetical protein
LCYLGGAIAFNSKKSASIIECVFDRCKSVNIGGSIWIGGSDESLTSLTLSHLFFTNSISLLKLGIDIAFESDDATILNDFLTSTNISLSRSQNDKSGLIHKLEVVNNNEGIFG